MFCMCTNNELGRKSALISEIPESLTSLLDNAELPSPCVTNGLQVCQPLGILEHRLQSPWDGGA